MKKRLLSLLLASCLVAGISAPTSAVFDTSEKMEENTFVSTSTLNNPEDISSNDLNDNENQTISSLTNTDADKEHALLSSSERTSKSTASYNLGVSPSGNLTATLDQDQIHILQFQLNQDTVLFSKVTSSNSQYAFQIYKINNGSLEQYSGAVTAGNPLNGTIPAGQYAFVIANLGSSYGASYTIYMNTQTPFPETAKTINVLNISNSYKHITVQMQNSSQKNMVYCDGVEVINENNTSALDWERVLDLSWSGGYNYNKHEIYNAKVKGISNRGTYTSDYVSSNNAVILFLDAGTGYMYNESKRNTNTGEHVFHFYDPFGNTTPRTLTEADIENYHCWLVFDLNSGKPIDFWSSLNWYYATGTEKASFSLNGDN